MFKSVHLCTTLKCRQSVLAHSHRKVIQNVQAGTRIHCVATNTRYKQSLWQCLRSRMHSVACIYIKGTNSVTASLVPRPPLKLEKVWQHSYSRFVQYFSHFFQQLKWLTDHSQVLALQVRSMQALYIPWLRVCCFTPT